MNINEYFRIGDDEDFLDIRVDGKDLVVQVFCRHQLVRVLERRVDLGELLSKLGVSTMDCREALDNHEPYKPFF